MLDPSSELPHGSIEDLLDRHRVQKLAALVAAQGLDEEGIHRVVRLVQAVLSKEPAGRASAIEFQSDVGHVLSQVAEHGSMHLEDPKQPGAAGVTLALTEDLALLVQTLLRAVGPRFATGQDLHRTFANDGPASRVSLEPPPEEPYVTPSLEDALGRHQHGDADESAGSGHLEGERLASPERDG